VKMKRLNIITISVIATILLFSGCGGPPEGMKEYRRLSEEEKDRLVEIALDTEDAKRSLERHDTYVVFFGWAEINWQKPESEYIPREIHITHEDDLDEDQVQNLGEDGELYAAVTFYFGDPSRIRLDVIVNPDTGEIIHVERMRLKTIPTDALELREN
jgi:hypothetical protein